MPEVDLVEVGAAAEEAVAVAAQKMQTINWGR